MVKHSLRLAEEWLINLEEGFDQQVAEDLRKRGHKVNWPIKGTLFYLILLFSAAAF